MCLDGESLEAGVRLVFGSRPGVCLGLFMEDKGWKEDEGRSEIRLRVDGGMKRVSSSQTRLFTPFASCERKSSSVPSFCPVVENYSTQLRKTISFQSR